MTQVHTEVARIILAIHTQLERRAWESEIHVTRPTNVSTLPKLRPATASDDAFLFQLYAGTRTKELAATGWSASQRETFLRTQFADRRRGYHSAFPEATHLIIVQGGTRVGAMIVNRTVDEIRLVDIALLPVQRGVGIGSRLISDLMEEARVAAKPLRLQVLKDSPAVGLYIRLGFAPNGSDALRLKMQWPASGR